MMDCMAVTLSAILAVTSPPSDIAAHKAAEAVCEASARHHVHPSWLVAYMAVENKDFQAKGQGRDVGLWQINLRWNRHRFAGRDVLDYRAQADVAAEIIAENLERFGYSWEAVAAYNSWRHASRRSDLARRYFLRWRAVMRRIVPLWTDQFSRVEDSVLQGGVRRGDAASPGAGMSWLPGNPRPSGRGGCQRARLPGRRKRG